jgi:hypothetical protein|tara:strand:+ start:754 stop:1236 length:483 start_codon:yes stop_codon:yes gene_type:complete
MIEEDIVGRLFDAFGKRLSEGQGRIYMEWVTKAGRYSEDIIEASIQNDATFPPLARLNSALINKRSSERASYDPNVERCYYCLDTGFVPYLYDPEGISAERYYIKMFACKCSQAIVGIPKYFDEWNEVQFEQGDYEKHFLYPHIVDAIMMDRNNRLNNGV